MNKFTLSLISLSLMLTGLEAHLAPRLAGIARVGARSMATSPKPSTALITRYQAETFLIQSEQYREQLKKSIIAGNKAGIFERYFTESLERSARRKVADSLLNKVIVAGWITTGVICYGLYKTIKSFRADTTK
jgi:hypothetical protein